MGRPRSATRSSITAKIILALTTKYAVPRQMKPRFLDLSIRVSKATEKDLIVFLFLSWDG